MSLRRSDVIEHPVYGQAVPVKINGLTQSWGKGKDFTTSVNAIPQGGGNVEFTATPNDTFVRLS